MLYNIEALYPFLQELTIHSYSYLSFWVPIIRALNETDTKMVMSSAFLLSYNCKGDNWSSTDERYLNTLLGIRTLFDFRYGLNGKVLVDFRKAFSSVFKSKRIISRILSIPEHPIRLHYYKLLKPYLSGSLRERCLSKVQYYLVTYCNVPPSLLRRLGRYFR